MMILIILLTSMIGNFAFLIFLSQLLPNRLNIKKMMLLVVPTIIPIFLQVIFQFEHPSAQASAISFLLVPIFFIIVFLFYQGKPWNRCIVLIVLLILQILSEVLSVLLSPTFDFSSGVWVCWNRYKLLVPDMGTLMVRSVSSALYLIFFIFLGSLFVFLWKMIDTKKFQRFYALFFIFPVSQVIFLYSVTYMNRILLLISVFLNIMICLAMLIYTMAQEERAALQVELQETKQAMELEQLHYQEMEKRREELAMVRHDLNNQLATISQLIRKKEEGSATEMIQSLAAEISQTAENPYCEMPIVNAIVTEKMKVCEMAGISLEVKLELPANLCVQPIHLCSIFGNLLDNGIAACKEMLPGETKAISLITLLDGDYLFIKMTNSSKKPPQKPLPGRGYGSRIISDIVARYEGDYRTRYKEGEFTAVLSLLTNHSL